VADRESRRSFSDRYRAAKAARPGGGYFTAFERPAAPPPDDEQPEPEASSE